MRSAARLRSASLIAGPAGFGALLLQALHRRAKGLVFGEHRLLDPATAVGWTLQERGAVDTARSERGHTRVNNEGERNGMQPPLGSFIIPILARLRL